MAQSRQGSAANFPFNILVLLAAKAYMLAMLGCINNVDATIYNLPPILSSCLTPLDPSATEKWSKELSHEETLKNVSSFCDEGGLICDESIETPSAQLHRFSTYKLANTKEANLMQHDDDMFFKESLLSIGNLIKLPMQEPHIPTRAFLPPLLEPQLFNHSTSLLSHVLLPFGFHIGTPLANSMDQTLQICSTPLPKGETKACVATFEDMLDFAKSSIGTSDVAVLVGATLPDKQLVIVMDLHEVTWDGEARRASVACHNAMFPFQVFYCHHIQGTKVFQVTLQTTINKIVTNISALASCHPLEASSHLPPPSSHINFPHIELLCHWNYDDNIVWILATTTNVFSPFTGYTKFSGLPVMSNPPHIAKF